MCSPIASRLPLSNNQVGPYNILHHHRHQLYSPTNTNTNTTNTNTNTNTNTTSTTATNHRRPCRAA